MLASTILSSLLLLAGYGLAYPSLNHRAVNSEVLKRYGEHRIHRRVEEHLVPLYERRKLEDDHTFEMVFRLKAADEDLITQKLAELHDPEHESHMQWLSPEEAWELVAPARDTLEMALEFLELHGFDRSAVELSDDRRNAKFNVTIAQANHMLKADYAHHVHGFTGVALVKTPHYSLPDSLHGLVEHVWPGTSLVTANKHGSAHHQARQKWERRIIDRHSPNKRNIIEPRAKPVNVSAYAKGYTPGKHTPGGNHNDIKGNPISGALTSALKECYENMGTNCLRQLYHIPSTFSTGSNTVGIINFYHISPSLSDIQAGVAAQIGQPAGSYVYPTYDIQLSGFSKDTSAQDPSEPDLDFQIMIPLVYPTPVYNYMGPNYNSEAFFYTMSAIGLSGVPLSNVVSMSWGATFEATDDYKSYGGVNYCGFIASSQLQGATWVVSTGDNGAQQLEVPAICDYVVSVGASEIYYKNSVTSKEVAEGPDGDFSYYGGGGYSWTVPSPSYAATAFNNYLPKVASAVACTQCVNKAATPDVAAEGRDIPIYYQGSPVYYGGTSASAPLVAAILTVVNGNLIAAGKPKIGSPLPKFYANQASFRDVISGSNSDNGNYWKAASGWDPATGLGTPTYDRIYAMFS